MLKILPIVSSLFAAATLWGQIEPVGVTTGQTVRLKVSARPPYSCAAQLGFLDSGGNAVGPSAQVSLQAGQSTALELPSSPVVKEPGQRVEIRPRVTLDPGTAESACQTNMVVLDKDGKPTRVPAEGVKLNGQLIVDVRNPDGTLAIHRQSSNADGAPGASLLASSLARLNVIGLWSIQLSGSACSFAFGGSCYIFENADDPPANFTGAFKGLSLYRPTTGPNAGELVLVGSFIAPQSGTVTGIETSFNYCSTNAIQTGCQFVSGFTLSTPTFTLAAQNVSVTAGQLIQVTVVFGFS
jgi:hypothetical protein